MRRLQIILLFVLLALSGCAAPDAVPAQQGAVTRPAQIDTAATQLSQQGLFRISYRTDLDPITINTLHSWTLQIETAAGEPVAGGAVSVEGGMPEHNHGMPTEPVVSAGDAGSYLVEGMKFQMPGWWTVTVTVDAGEQTDSATFHLLLN
jgi:hypothetical protein